MTSRTVTQESEPWAGVQPQIQDVVGGAQDLYSQGVGQNYFPISTVVPFSNQTETALQAMEGRAMAGMPAQDNARHYADKTMRGYYLNNNPYLDQTFNRMADGVMSKVNSYMGQAGRTRSGAHQDLMFDNLGDLGNQVYGQNYQMERDRQQQVLPMIPQLAAADYQDIDRLFQAGQMREGLGRNYMEDLINRWNFSQQAPWATLGQYSNIAQGIGTLGGSAATTQPANYFGAAGGALGGALGGLAVGGPFGAVLGGLGGLLGGL